jgi:hypothetical protein
MAEKKASGKGGARPGAGHPFSEEGPVKQVTIGLPLPLLGEVDARAKRQRRTRAEVVRDLLKAGIAAEKPDGSE